MHYIIDGYNLFFKVRNEVSPLHKCRENFLQDFVFKLKTANMHATFVFDSHYKYAGVFPSLSTLETVSIVFSPKNLSADCYILEKFKWKSHLFTLVTSDRKLSLQARSLGAQTTSVENFIALLSKRYKKKQADNEVPLVRESKANLQRLLQIFEKLSRDENA